MFNEEIRKMNIKTKTLYERYLRIADEKTAIIMACVDGKQPEICEFILELEKQNQAILMEETLKYLVPREELYPHSECTEGTYPVGISSTLSTHDDTRLYITGDIQRN